MHSEQILTIMHILVDCGENTYCLHLVEFYEFERK